MENGSQSKQQFWWNHIKAWQAGKLSQSSYCRQHGLKLATFNRQVKKYFAQRGSLVKVATSPASHKQETIDVLIAGRYLIRLGTDFDRHLLQEVIQALEEVKCS
jgi:hypothetical protein